MGIWKQKTNIEGKKTMENQNETIKESIKQKKTGFLNKLIFFILFAVTAVFMFWTSKIQTVNNKYLVMWLTVMVLITVSIIFILIGTRIGIEIIKRFLNKLKYKTGLYVNSLHIMKSGVVKERFIKKDTTTGSIQMAQKPYVTNPTLLFIYKSIPTYLYKEGNPDPVNIWKDQVAQELSNSEMDEVMHSSVAFDVKAWLERNKVFIMIGMIVIVLSALISAYFGYNSFQMLRDGTFKAVEVACQNMPTPTEILTSKLT